MLDVSIITICLMFRTKVITVCPHISFPNPLSPSGATPRESVETRSVVIHREEL